MSTIQTIEDKQHFIEENSFIIKIAIKTNQQKHSMHTFDRLLQFIQKHNIEPELSTF